MSGSLLTAGRRTGLAYWWGSYVSLLRFDLARHRTMLVAVLASQLLMGIGVALMYGLYLGSVDPTTALYLVSGVPALSLIPVGLVMVPILVVVDKSAGTHEFTWSLPVPRLVIAASTFTLFTVIALPVSFLSTVLAAWRFDVALSPSPLVVPAGLLVSLMGTSVGFGLAQAIPEPRLTNLVVNVIVFVVLLFSPIAIPLERFPDWAAAVHSVLPFHHMANLLRATVTEGVAGDVGRSLAVVAAWTVGGWAATGLVVGRRR